jgi:hypothetical protein
LVFVERSSHLARSIVAAFRRRPKHSRPICLQRRGSKLALAISLVFLAKCSNSPTSRAFTPPGAFLAQKVPGAVRRPPLAKAINRSRSTEFRRVETPRRPRSATATRGSPASVSHSTRKSLF